jgi:hypothetical protein
MLVNLLAAIAATCDFDETAAPASTAAEYHSRCYKFVGMAESLRECVAWTGYWRSRFNGFNDFSCQAPGDIPLWAAALGWFRADIHDLCLGCLGRGFSVAAALDDP